MNVLQHTRNELNLGLKQNRPDRSYRDTLLNDKSRNLQQKGKPWRILVVVVNDVIMQMAYLIKMFLKMKFTNCNSVQIYKEI